MQTRDVLHLVAELERDPSLRGVLGDALRLHDQHAGDELWLGFEAAEVHAGRRQAQLLLEARVIDQKYRSNTTRTYLLADVAGVRDALRVASAPAPVVDVDAGDPEIPADLFDIVEGHDRVKRILHAALAAERPVHGLLWGPPGNAKSLFLSELERLPGARRALGSTTTRAGIVSFLLAEPGCRYLLIDEIDKADGRDLTTLYGLMAEQRVERLQARRQEQERRTVWVFATANDTDGMRDALLSRFAGRGLYLPAYTEDEFRRVALAVLVRREGADPELAAEIAQAVTPWTRDPRAAVDIYRLSAGERKRVAQLVAEVLAA